MENISEWKENLRFSNSNVEKIKFYSLDSNIQYKPKPSALIVKLLLICSFKRDYYSKLKSIFFINLWLKIKVKRNYPKTNVYFKIFAEHLSQNASSNLL